MRSFSETVSYARLENKKVVTEKEVVKDAGLAFSGPDNLNFKIRTMPLQANRYPDETMREIV